MSDLKTAAGCLILFVLLASQAMAATPCEGLSKLSLSRTTITLAQTVAEGWNDTSVPPKVAINYYKKVVEKVGAKIAQESMRFFMVPGMAHGAGTTGAENFNYDPLATIELWKQTGKPPEELLMTHYKNGMEVGRRLVCQYPKVALYKGSGNTEGPGSFQCK